MCKWWVGPKWAPESQLSQKASQHGDSGGPDRNFFCGTCVFGVHFCEQTYPSHDVCHVDRQSVKIFGYAQSRRILARDDRTSVTFPGDSVEIKEKRCPIESIQQQELKALV